MATAAIRDCAMHSAEIVESVLKRFSRVAMGIDAGFGVWTGNRCAEYLGYGDVLDGIPVVSLESFVGVGNPASFAGLVAGERVLDVGCGAGLDALVAAAAVGRDGVVVGVDITPEMIERAHEAAAMAPWAPVTFLVADAAERLPFEDGSFDVVQSNGCLNLSPRKRELLSEVNRVLRPGGRLALCDAVLKADKAAEVTADPDNWSL
jgi:SAM-dependent methyltransferase